MAPLFFLHQRLAFASASCFCIVATLQSWMAAAHTGSSRIALSRRRYLLGTTINVLPVLPVSPLAPS
jgi:hypothetical protein